MTIKDKQYQRPCLCLCKVQMLIRNAKPWTNMDEKRAHKNIHHHISVKRRSTVKYSIEGEFYKINTMTRTSETLQLITIPPQTKYSVQGGEYVVTITSSRVVHNPKLVVPQGSDHNAQLFNITIWTHTPTANLGRSGQHQLIFSRTPQLVATAQHPNSVCQMAVALYFKYNLLYYDKQLKYNLCYFSTCLYSFYYSGRPGEIMLHICYFSKNLYRISFAVGL